MATNKDATWEVVDGVQRLSTLLHFVGEPDLLGVVGKKDPLKLQELTKLTYLNEQTFALLPRSVQLQFLLRPLKVTTLNDRSDLNVRYELFERLNTGGVKLHPQEIRNWHFSGLTLRSQLKTLSVDVDFRNVVILRGTEQTEALYEECILRFFAFLDRYQEFGHLVDRFLTDYAKDKNAKGVEVGKIAVFHETMKFLSAELPDGVFRNRRSTPLNLYEAVAVGTALVVLAKKPPKTGVLVGLLNDPQLEKFTKGGTNSRAMVAGRIEPFAMPLPSNAVVHPHSARDRSVSYKRTTS